MVTKEYTMEHEGWSGLFALDHGMRGLQVPKSVPHFVIMVGCSSMLLLALLPVPLMVPPVPVAKILLGRSPAFTASSAPG